MPNDDRQTYLVRFLRGCAGAADDKQLGVDLGRLMVNGDLMREAADLLENSCSLEHDDCPVLRRAEAAWHSRIADLERRLRLGRPIGGR